MADQQEAKPTNNGEGWGLPEHPNDSAVHDVPMWAKFTIVAVLINLGMCLVSYNMGHDSGVIEGADRYAVQVGTAAARMPYECKQHFYRNLKDELNNMKGDR